MNQLSNAVSAFLFSVIIFLGIIFIPQHTVQAATITVSTCDANDLIAAIESANTSTENDTIVLNGACIYTLTTVNNTLDGNNGLPDIADSGGGDPRGTLTINGNGATITRDSAAPQFRIFHLDGYANLTLNNLTISGGASTAQGGAIASYFESRITLNDSIIQGNVAASDGGGIYSDVGTLTITNTTIRDNTAGGSGGGIYHVGNTMTINTSLIAYNAASGVAPSGSGGGIYSGGGTNDVFNTTILSNTAVSQAGGIRVTAGRTTLWNTTIYGNSANYYGGVTGSELRLRNTIVAGNSAVARGPDVGGSLTSMDYNLIQDPTEATFSGNADYNLYGVDPMLVPLADNGGPTLTMALLPSSPAVDAGKCDPGTDQRGTGYNRPIDMIHSWFPNASNGCDMGAFEVQALYFSAADEAYIIDYMETLAVPAPGVLGNDLDPNELMPTATVVTPPQYALAFVLNPDGSFNYTPQPDWYGTDSFIYQASSASGSDTATVNITVGPNFNIACNDITGLIDAINHANINDRADTLNLASDCTYVLTTSVVEVAGGNGLPILRSPITIEGNNATLLRDSTAPEFRFMLIDTGGDLHLKDVTLSGGKITRNGGAVYNANGNLTITRSRFIDNMGSSGGGVCVNYGAGMLTITDSTFANNSATHSGGAVDGLDLQIEGSTFYNNTAGDRGGAVDTVALEVSRSTFFNNWVGDYGGAINMSSGKITDSTIYGNRSLRYAGGIRKHAGTAYVTNSIIAGNTAQYNPDVEGTFFFYDYNLIQETSGLNVDGFDSHTIYGVDPQLSFLQDNGGATWTMEPLANSPVIDAGNCEDGIDQRGSIRPVDLADKVNINDACDIGAVELQDHVTAFSDSYVIDFGESLTVAAPGVLANDFDPDGLPISASLLAPPAHAQTFNLQPNGAFTYTPQAGWHGTDTFTYTATSSGGSDTTTVTIAVGPDFNLSCGDVNGLIEAIDHANRNGKTDNTITLAADCTYTLTTPNNFVASGTGLPVITGQMEMVGSNTIIERSSAEMFRIFYVANTGTLVLDDLTIRSGHVADFAGGILNYGDLTIKNSTISGNTADYDGLVPYSGGGVYSAVGTLTIDSSTISGNIATQYGGGVMISSGIVNITNSTVSGNTAVDEAGGGIHVSFYSKVTIDHSTITNNASATDGSNLSNYLGTSMTVSYSIVSGAQAGANCTDGVVDGGHNLADDTSCGFADTDGTGLGSGVDPMLVPLADNGGPTQTHALQPGSAVVNTGGVCGLPLDQRGYPRNALCDIGAFEVAYTVTVAASGPGSGTITDAGINCTSTAGTTSGDCWDGGESGTTFSLTAAALAGSTFDHWTGCTSTSGESDQICTVTLGDADVEVTVHFKADTNTAITADLPDPSVSGEAVEVAFTVNSAAPGTPTGNVTVTDGTDSCVGTVAEGVCTLHFSSSGLKSLTATYAGDDNFNTSTSEPVEHTVNKADTSIVITSHNANPSVVGETITVAMAISVDSPGAGTPTGQVSVNGGDEICNAYVVNGVAGCTLTYTSPGVRNLTATYAGDSDFNGSVAPSVEHTVNKADTSVTITAHTPDPSITGDVVTVSYTVVANTPGAGTPTGNVSISSGSDSCVGTVAAGSCVITLTSAGEHTLTAIYAGDSNFNSSNNMISHTVKSAATTTMITADSPDASVVGQSVTVSYSVTSTAPGTPTGNVTISSGSDSCVGTVAAGSCAIILTSAGEHTLTATYAGDSDFAGSSDTELHTVNPASTITAIILDNPDPSGNGRVVTVWYTVTPVAPGSGAPTGSVTVTDGVNSCIGTVAADKCDITLTTVGTRSLVATYAGDGNYTGSVSTAATHEVLEQIVITEQELFAEMQRQIAAGPASKAINFALADFLPGQFHLTINMTDGTTGAVIITVDDSDVGYFLMEITSVTVNGAVAPQSFVDAVHRELLALLVDSLDAVITQKTGSAVHDLYSFDIDEATITIGF